METFKKNIKCCERCVGNIKLKTDPAYIVRIFKRMRVGGNEIRTEYLTR